MRTRMPVGLYSPRSERILTMKIRAILMSSSFVLIALLLAFATAAAQAGKPLALNVKLGLWEMTTSTQMSGMPPIGRPSDKMTPEQKAQLDTAMKAAAEEAAKPQTLRTCLTKDKLEKSLFQDGSQSCKQTVVTNTATVVEVKIECADRTGQPATSGDFRFEALTPESVKGSGSMTMMGPSKMSSKVTMTAKWLGASCGDVK